MTIQNEEIKKRSIVKPEHCLNEKLDNAIQECKETVVKIESWYNKGLILPEDLRRLKIDTALNAWKKIKEFCTGDKFDLDDAFQALFASVGITIKKVLVRYYPTVELMTGSLYYFYRLKNQESLFNDSDPIGKMFKFKITMEMGKENVLLDYSFKVESENFELEEMENWKGWRCYDGMGKPEGYQWAEAAIHVREYNGEVQSVAIQKTYIRSTEPIWKRHSACPIDGYRWIGINEDIPDNLEITEGEYYSDATTEPPQGRCYREHGILAYDDTEEITILGIKDPDVEVVEIPQEINGKPVTVLDERCFANCSDALRKVILPDTLKEIGDYAFENCKNLEKPLIPASVTKIGKNII